METSSEIKDYFKELSGSSKLVRWPIPMEIESSPEVVYRNLVAQELVKKNAPEIVKSYTYLSQNEMDKLVAITTKHLLSKPLRGTGLELGAGCGLLASVVAKQKDVDLVLAVEICDQMAGLVVSKIASWVLGQEANKIMPVAGTFDELKLPNNSIDFALEIDSFHHSGNLPKTLSETARVLKHGGTLVCFDRCHPNSVTNDEVDEMLSVVYTPETLVEMGYPPDTVLTRGQNGEHEYRLYEWKNAFEKSGLILTKMSKFYTKLPFKLFLKGLLSVLPEPLRRRFYTTDNATFGTAMLWLGQIIGYPVRSAEWDTYIASPHETTVFILEKP